MIRAQDRPQKCPFAVMVKFDRYSCPTVDGSVPICPITRGWTHGGTTCTRTQLPLALAWAVTVPKSQGMTLNEPVVNVGETKFVFGMSYVSCNSVRAWKDMLIHPMFSRERSFKLRNS